MTYINITKFVLINQLEKDHGMIETRRLKNVVIFIHTLKKHRQKLTAVCCIGFLQLYV